MHIILHNNATLILGKKFEDLILFFLYLYFPINLLLLLLLVPRELVRHYQKYQSPIFYLIKITS